MYASIEGGFFAIRGDDRTTYDPINLPQPFQQSPSQRIRVRFRARLRPDLMGIHMVGPIVEVLEIPRL